MHVDSAEWADVTLGKQPQNSELAERCVFALLFSAFPRQGEEVQQVSGLRLEALEELEVVVREHRGAEPFSMHRSPC
jgi:hypothetical protein